MYAQETGSEPAPKQNERSGGERQVIGRVVSVAGSGATIRFNSNAVHDHDAASATVGKFLGIVSGQTVIVGMVTSVSEQPNDPDASVAHIDLFGELKKGRDRANFSRGVTEYPVIGEPALLMSSDELRLIYAAIRHVAQVGSLYQDPKLPAVIDIDELLTKHFAVLGTTGVGKSTGVAVILQQVLVARPDLRIFLVDPHNEYGHCFGDKANVLNPRNLRLPFWLFNFDETVDAFFGGQNGNDDEIEILSEVIPLAKVAYLQYRTSQDRTLIKRREHRGAGFTADTPTPYRIEDLVTLIDDRMGKLENRNSRTHHSRLLQRIQTFRNNPRYAFMFDNANVGGDTMAEIISNLFRLPANGKPMTVMQLAGFPAEVIDSVVSVLCRMAFDFGLWSDGISPMLFVCEEAHRYASADAKQGFGPTRRALSRIAKEGRKYGVYLGLITQRPAEIDPTIISQCNTLFVMRMANERDQALIRSAVSDAATSLLTFLPSLGTGEVFVFGPGVALPMRMKFRNLPESLRPTSEVGSPRHAQTDTGLDLISSVIERWRNSTMSTKVHDDEAIEAGLSAAQSRTDIPASQARTVQAPAIQPAYPALSASGQEPPRSRLLKQPISATPTASDSFKNWRS